MNPLELFSPADSSESGLFEWLRQKISRKMLEEIAANDYSEEVWDHFAAIERQLSKDPAKGLLAWCPREVLELERWTEPQMSSQTQPLDESYAHKKRLLACALLLQSAATIDVSDANDEEEFFLDTSAVTLIQLTRSAISLGGECRRHSLEFLLWFYSALHFPRLSPFTAFSVFLLWLDNDEGRAGCAAIEKAWEWVDAQERLYRTLHPNQTESDRWLVGISSYEDRDGHRLRWFATARQVLERQGHCQEQVNAIRATLQVFEKG
jgi:hypothetical protein